VYILFAVNHVLKLFYFLIHYHTDELLA